MKFELPRHIVDEVHEICQSRAVHVLEITVRGSSHRRVIEIFVDSEDGVDFEICRKLSAEIGELIDGKSVFPAAYRLDVSSPGIDRPLRHVWQYRKNIGRLLDVSLREGGSAKGRLIDVSDSALTLEPRKVRSSRAKANDSELVNIPFAHVEKAIVEVEW